jgi:GTP-binding protein Era
LPHAEALYPENIICDFPRNNLIADIIREKLMNLMRQEIPYSLAVLIEELIERSKSLWVIKAKVYIDTDSQRRIVIGKGGRIIKKVGTLARRELEGIFDKKIYLELYVDKKKAWRNDPRLLRVLGYYP